MKLSTGSAAGPGASAGSVTPFGTTWTSRPPIRRSQAASVSPTHTVAANASKPRRAYGMETIACRSRSNRSRGPPVVRAARQNSSALQSIRSTAAAGVEGSLWRPNHAASAPANTSARSNRRRASNSSSRSAEWLEIVAPRNRGRPGQRDLDAIDDPIRAPAQEARAASPPSLSPMPRRDGRPGACGRRGSAKGRAA